MKSLTVIHHKVNQGYGRATISGLSEAIKDYDRDAVHSIPIYADLMEMAVYKDDRNKKGTIE